MSEEELSNLKAKNKNKNKKFPPIRFGFIRNDLRSTNLEGKVEKNQKGDRKKNTTKF